jgi:succinoglycan biosynthesis protein ExoA
MTLQESQLMPARATAHLNQRAEVSRAAVGPDAGRVGYVVAGAASVASPDGHSAGDGQATESRLPFLSVIVPVRNEERFISGTLEQLLHQDYDPERFEILVADGQSTDATRAIVRAVATRASNLRLLSNPGRWSSAGRNAALRVARGEIVVIVDGHCDLGGPHYLRAVAEAFERSGADCLGRPQPLNVQGATAFQRALAAARASWLGHHPASFIYASGERFVPAHSVAVAYRRTVFERIGMFDEDFDACEDVDLNHRVDRAGLHCWFTTQIQTRYFPRSSPRGLFRQMVRYGRGRVRLLRKHPDTFTLASLMPALLLAGVVAGAGLTWLSTWLTLAYCSCLAAYAAVVFLVSFFLASRARDARLLPWLPLVFLTVHFGAGVGSLLEGIGNLGGTPLAASRKPAGGRAKH